MKLMEKNVGQFDKTVRILLGILLVVSFALNWVSEPLAYVVLLIGVAMLFTGLYGTCALYSLMGISTTERAKKKKK